MKITNRLPQKTMVTKTNENPEQEEQYLKILIE